MSYQIFYFIGKFHFSQHKVIAKSLIFYFLETNIHTQERENEILTQIDHKSVSKHTKLTLIPSSLCYCGDMVTMANYNPLSF